MRTTIAAALIAATVSVVGFPIVSAAQRGGVAYGATRKAWTVPVMWLWHMGMLRGTNEIDAVATLELKKATGTVRVGGQPCTLGNYRASINYQIPGMRAQYSCTLPNGQTHQAIEVVSGAFAWDEDVVGAELMPGRGKATPRQAAVAERLIRLWAGPQGAAKAAVAAGDKTTVALEAGKSVVTYPIPGVSGATGRATLTGGAAEGVCTRNCAERIEVRHGNTVTEFTYSNYGDYNHPLNKVDGFFPGRIVERRDGVTVLDLTVSETEVGNLYVVMPVPESVRQATR